VPSNILLSEVTVNLLDIVRYHCSLIGLGTFTKDMRVQNFVTIGVCIRPQTC